MAEPVFPNIFHPRVAWEGHVRQTRTTLGGEDNVRSLELLE